MTVTDTGQTVVLYDPDGRPKASEGFIGPRGAALLAHIDLSEHPRDSSWTHINVDVAVGRTITRFCVTSVSGEEIVFSGDPGDLENDWGAAIRRADHLTRLRYVRGFGTIVEIDGQAPQTFPDGDPDAPTTIFAADVPLTLRALREIWTRMLPGPQ